MHFRGALAALQNQDQLASFKTGQIVSFPI